MRTIVSIKRVHEWVDGNNKPHKKTFVVLDDGLEAAGYGTDFQVGDSVEVFHDDKWNQVKVRKGKKGNETVQERTTK